jgi:hypothetical protein
MKASLVTPPTTYSPQGEAELATSKGDKGKYPRIPEKNWWDLRRQFVQSPPREVTAGYLRTVLNVSESFARQIAAHLRTLGLVDDQGRPTPLASDWRDDHGYAEACKQMREAVYPSELLSALAPPNPQVEAVRRWFAGHANVGSESARQMATVYLLLCEADPMRADGRPRETSQVAVTSDKTVIPAELRRVFEASWQKNERAYRYLGEH